MALYGWNVECHQVAVNGTRVTCSSEYFVVIAEDEDDVRNIFAEDMPGMVIDKITIGRAVDDE